MFRSELPLKKWLQKALLILCGLLLPLTIVEFAMRAYARLASQERTITADYLLGWKLIPHTKHLFRKEEQPYLIVINSKGLRDREHSYEKSKGLFRIVVVGDSFVFGSGGVEASDRFTDILEKSTRNVEVINMGVPAYGTDQEYLYLKREGLKYHPDLVILCVFAADFARSFFTVNPSNGRPKGYFSITAGQLVFHPPSFPVFYKLSQRSYLLGLSYMALDKVFRSYWKVHQLDVINPQDRVDTFKHLFIGARDLCKEQGSKFVVVYFPWHGQKNKGFIEQTLDELAASEDIKILNLMNDMDRANTEKRAYFEHDIHFNESGHQAVAKALQEYLVTNGLLNSAALQPKTASRPD